VSLPAPVADVLRSFAGVAPRWLALALALHVANHLLRSLAWRNVLRAAYPDARLPLTDVAAAYATGVALNGTLPGRGGDLAKAALLRRRLTGSSLPTIAATMSVLVLFDLVAATVLGALVVVTGGAPLVPRLPGAPRWAADHLPLVLAGAAVAALLAVVVVRRAGPRLRGLAAKIRQGGAILRRPGTFLRTVASVQALAWCCRVAVVFCLLAAFGLHASVPAAGTVMVLCGVSTLVPLTPGGAGAQQVLVTYALTGVGSAAGVLAFSVGMQAGITAVNAVLGIAGAMVAFRTARPWRALRAGLRLARAPGVS
jgi:uncharacterized membrane protein YbhN (UPF0104 family)